MPAILFFVLFALCSTAFSARESNPTPTSSPAAPWWSSYTPIVSVKNYSGDELDKSRATAARGANYFGGWYGWWYLDAQEQGGRPQAAWQILGRKDIKKIMYYDLGEVGDYAAFFNPNGALVTNGWLLPHWKGTETLTARWFGLEAFMQNVPWAPFPTAKHYGLPPFTTPEGAPATDLYSVLTQRGLDGNWQFDFFSNPQISDELADHSGLAKISQKQSGESNVQQKSGWQTVRLINVDFANPQLRNYICRDIQNLIPRLKPDGVHADNFGDANLGFSSQSAFGLWSQHAFREFLQQHFSGKELSAMGIREPAAFDIAKYIRNQRRNFQNVQWTEDPVWLCYMISMVESSQTYHRAFYQAAKTAARDTGIDCCVFGNTIPLPLAGSLMKGSCDVVHFEWSTFKGWWGMRPMGLPPHGRIGYVARLGAAISDVNYCWPSLYVTKEKSGAGHENLHKVLAFDALSNHALLDYGQWFLDGYSPGTAESAGFINGFIRSHAAPLSGRRFLPDVGVVHSAWSEIASHHLVNPVMSLFVDEYSGWCQFLGDSHRQWDVLLQQDLTARNLSRFPIIVLPSVLSLSDEQIDALRNYAAHGGRIVATGATGSRFGPEKFLKTRPAPLSIPGARIVPDKPGVDYWNNDASPKATERMTELLAWPGISPLLKTDAPATVGINLNEGADKSRPLLILDLCNYDIDVDTDTLHPAPKGSATIRLPKEWQTRNLQVRGITPEGLSEELSTKQTDGELQIQYPSFESFLLVLIQPKQDA